MTETSPDGKASEGDYSEVRGTKKPGQNCADRGYQLFFNGQPESR